MFKLNSPFSAKDADAQVLKFWREHSMFEKSIAHREDGKDYIFYDGPPFATGLPHYGHILVSAIKDAVPRYWTMRGYRVPRRWGWDCHGLPIENIVEKQLGISGRHEIEKFGIERFNETARSQVLTYVDGWKDTIERIARWVDFEGSYKTMDNTYIESVWWAFSEVHKKKLLYEGTRVLPFCSRCETPVAQSEIAMDNSYQDVTEPAVYVRFKLKKGQSIGGDFITDDHTYILAWTTTPWTLLGNVALAVGEDIEYLKTMKGSDTYIASTHTWKRGDFGDFGNMAHGDVVTGKNLVGLEYEPLFHVQQLEDDKSYKIYAADFVTTEEGTGVVHTAVMYGEDDHALGVEVGLPQYHTVEQDGTFNNSVHGFTGLHVKDDATTEKIFVHLEKQGYLFKKEDYTHSYPHCHRCDTPLLYYAIPAWFIDIANSDIKERALELNERIQWIPEHLKHGQFKNILEGAPDWNISRSRYWASPLPIWKCAKCKKVTVIGSRAELKKHTETKHKNSIDDLDLHRPYIDAITLKCSCGGHAERIPEVFDCWFESASMTFAMYHYPFENKDAFDANFPAQFITEYIPQTRTWFYYMLILSTILFDDIPFENVLTTGNILAEDGQKMSKSKHNFPDPNDLLDRFGADALRYYLFTSPVVRSEDVYFSEDGVQDVYRKIVMRLVNVLAFYHMYRDNAVSADAYRESPHVLDRWILHELHQLVNNVSGAMNEYDLNRATKPIGDFIDDLSTWYVRRSRDRFKGSDTDKAYALSTLRYVLHTLSKVMAPFTPIVAEIVYHGVNERKNDSVHLQDWPHVDDTRVDAEPSRSMAHVRHVASIGLAKRIEEGVKVRQPLQMLTVRGKQELFSDELIALIKDEVNVKEIGFDPSLGEEVSLDITLTPALKEEGMLREVVREVQRLRHKTGLQIDDRIALIVVGSSTLISALTAQTDVLKSSVGAHDVTFLTEKRDVGTLDVEIDTKLNGDPAWIGLRKM